jgi:peptide/nickel transport system ATP-binding protein/oligopeptide transport system ATP-binding protein
MTDLLEIDGLKKYFYLRHGAVKAINDLHMKIYSGETLGLVGESGCGKSTLGRLIIRLDKPTAGRICYYGENIYDFRGESLRRYRRQAQLIFQDPHASLNPRLTAGSIIGEPFLIHKAMPYGKRKEEVARLMELVGLSPEQMKCYPHEFSGGQRQRIGIARAVALRPKLIVADEPVSSLDVSIQAQILNLLRDLQRDLGLTYLFITHDLSVVRYMSDRIAVMYLGKIVDLANNDEQYEHHLHPYAKALLSAAPVWEIGRKKERIILNGDMPNPFILPSGCAFHPRCPYRLSICEKEEPLFEHRGDGHFTACHLKN